MKFPHRFQCQFTYSKQKYIKKTIVNAQPNGNTIDEYPEDYLKFCEAGSHRLYANYNHTHSTVCIFTAKEKWETILALRIELFTPKMLYGMKYKRIFIF